MLLPLLTHFERYLPFDEAEKQLFVGRVGQRQLKRRQAILQAGFPCQHYTFVVRGCLRLYAIDQKGTEHNLLFAAENEWIADISSFHSGQPSQLFIAALEPAVILQIDQQDLYFLYLAIPKLDRILKSSWRTSTWSYKTEYCKPSARPPTSATWPSWRNTRTWPGACPAPRLRPTWGLLLNF